MPYSETTAPELLDATRRGYLKYLDRLRTFVIVAGQSYEALIWIRGELLSVETAALSQIATTTMLYLKDFHPESIAALPKPVASVRDALNSNLQTQNPSAGTILANIVSDLERDGAVLAAVHLGSKLRPALNTFLSTFQTFDTLINLIDELVHGGPLTYVARKPVIEEHEDKIRNTKRYSIVPIRKSMCTEILKNKDQVRKAKTREQIHEAAYCLKIDVRAGLLTLFENLLRVLDDFKDLRRDIDDCKQYFELETWAETRDGEEKLKKCCLKAFKDCVGQPGPREVLERAASRFLHMIWWCASDQVMEAMRVLEALTEHIEHEMGFKRKFLKSNTF